MSQNLVAASPYEIVCVSDRRLVDFLSGEIRTNRSTKMTVFGCADAHGVIVYNGIGMDDEGMTPSDWILELAERERLFDCGLTQVLDRVAVDLESRLRVLRAKYGPKKARHTFLVAAWQQGASVIYGISNYERVDGPDEAAVGSEEITQSALLPTSEARIRIVATGSHPSRADVRAIAEGIKALSPRVKALCVKAVKDVAYGRGQGKGTVGASCQWALLGAKRDYVWYGLDVVGGAIAQEPPNLINIAAEVPLHGTFSARLGGPGIIIKDTYAGDEKAPNLAHYDAAMKTAVFPELMCGICGAPWPGCHRFCEVCLYEEHRGSKKGRRAR